MKTKSNTPTTERTVDFKGKKMKKFVKDKDGKWESKWEMTEDINKALKKYKFDIRLGMSDKVSIDTLVKEMRKEGKGEGKEKAIGELKKFKIKRPLDTFDLANKAIDQAIKTIRDK